MFYGAGVPDEHHDFDPTQLPPQDNRTDADKGGSRKGSPLEGESGLTPAGNTPPQPISPKRSPEEGGTTPMIPHKKINCLYRQSEVSRISEAGKSYNRSTADESHTTISTI